MSAMESFLIIFRMGLHALPKLLSPSTIDFEICVEGFDRRQRGNARDEQRPAIPDALLFDCFASLRLRLVRDVHRTSRRGV
mmetsp:Transcript_4988/g.8021  ORF Transcript_4988/g.8021 Transcript_4988/m.8021 type:complete len:81 (+) Transcript_4988:195-437(+)